MAEALTRTFDWPEALRGFRARALTTFSVPRTRLSRMAVLTSSFQRRLKMFSPARWTTASHLSTACIQPPGCVGSPSTTVIPLSNRFVASAGRRVKTMTSSCRSRRWRIRRVPIIPVPPVTKTRICSSSGASREYGTSVVSSPVPGSRKFGRGSPLSVGPVRLGDGLQGGSGQLLVAGLHGQVAQRDDADQPLVTVEHRQPADLVLLHQPGRLGDVLVLEDVNDVRRHDVLDT